MRSEAHFHYYGINKENDATDSNEESVLKQYSYIHNLRVQIKHVT